MSDSQSSSNEKKASVKELVLVTGATGFIASHLIKLLLDRDEYSVRASVRNIKDEERLKQLRDVFGEKLELVEADLTKEEGWKEAVDGCTYVLHTASPFPAYIPADEDEIVRPAFKGTLHLLNACADNGRIRRVVLTGSCSSMFGDRFDKGRVYKEKDWPNFRRLKPYAKSKVVAERIAWEFVKERKAKNLWCFELSVVNPGYVLGPILYKSESTSTKAIKSLMLNRIKLIPNYNFPVCDVRDVAEAHLKAMTLSEAKDKRHIIVSRVECLSFKEFALTLENEFKSRNYDIPTRIAPNCLVKLYSFFRKDAKQLTLNLGKEAFFDNTRMIEVLGIKPVALNETICEMAYSLIEYDLIPKRF